MQAEQQVGIDGIVQDLMALRFGQTGKIRASQFPIHAHGFNAVLESHGTANEVGIGLMVITAQIV